MKEIEEKIAYWRKLLGADFPIIVETGITITDPVTAEYYANHPEEFAKLRA